MPGQKPTYQNLGAGVKAYNTDWNNIAPSIGVNWTPTREGRLAAHAARRRRRDTSFSAGYSRAFDRRGMNDFTGRFGNNPGLTTNANRNTANGNLTRAAALPRRRPRSGADVPAAAGGEAAGCMLAAPEYPLSNQTATGSINDLRSRTCRCRTRTPGRSASSARSARGRRFEVRYVGTRSRQQWADVQLQRAEHPRERLPRRVQAAQAQPPGAHRGGLRRRGGPACSFAYRGAGTGTSPLPIYLAFFSGVPIGAGRGGLAVHVSNWTNSNFINPLGAVQSEPVHAGGHEREHRSRGHAGAAGERDRRRARRRTSSARTPTCSAARNATGNGGFTSYNAMQLQFRRRLSGGLQFDANYALGRAIARTHYSFRVPRESTRDDRRRGRRHARLQGDRRLRAAVRPRQAVRHDVERGGGRLVGGWQVSGTARLQSGRLFDLGNVRVVGMSRRGSAGPVQAAPRAARRSSTRGRRRSSTKTIKAYSVSATSPTGYGALGRAERPLLRAGERPGLHRDDQQRLRRCGVRTLVVPGRRC